MLKKYPFYIRCTMILFGLSLFVMIMVMLREILVPLSLALVLAILLNPLVNRFEKWGLPKLPSIISALVISLITLAVIAFFITMQVANFSDQLPVLKKQLAKSSTSLQNTIANEVGVTRQKQHQLVLQAEENMKPMAGHAVGSVLGTLAMILLLPVYTFLLLFYKTLILNFLYELFDREKSQQVTEILVETKSAIQSYMIGLLLEALIVAIMNSAALLLFGVKYAILIGVLGAILNMLPYLGGIIAIAIPVIMSILGGQPIQMQLGIMAAYGVIQFIDNQFIVPYIVSSKVKINALISIVAVFLGAAAWGLSGMFLSILFIGILKIVFDRVPELKPWGKLLGDHVPTRHKGQIWNRTGSKRALSEKITGDKEV